MIGRITPLPGFSNNQINYNSDAHSEKKPLINKKTGNVINVKNLDADFRVIIKEKKLKTQVKSTPHLANIAGATLDRSQNARFWSLGMAVTVIYNLGEDGKAKAKSVDICDKIPRNALTESNAHSAITKRGIEYIHQFINAETPLDSTNYAIGLIVGTGVQVNDLDPILINNFNSTWNIRLDMAT